MIRGWLTAVRRAAAAGADRFGRRGLERERAADALDQWLRPGLLTADALRLQGAWWLALAAVLGGQPAVAARLEAVASGWLCATTHEPPASAAVLANVWQPDRDGAGRPGLRAVALCIACHEQLSAVGMVDEPRPGGNGLSGLGGGE